MPHLAQKPHTGRIQRIVLGELELGGEDAALKGGAVGALDEGFPEEDVVFGDGAGGDAVRGGRGEELVFVEEPAGGDCGCHGWGGGCMGEGGRGEVRFFWGGVGGEAVLMSKGASAFYCMSVKYDFKYIVVLPLNYWGERETEIFVHRTSSYSPRPLKCLLRPRFATQLPQRRR